jgi:hypothetical protein
MQCLSIPLCLLISQIRCWWMTRRSLHSRPRHLYAHQHTHAARHARHVLTITSGVCVVFPENPQYQDIDYSVVMGSHDTNGNACLRVFFHCPHGAGDPRCHIG